MNNVVKLIRKIINDRDNISDVSLGSDEDLSFRYKGRDFELRTVWDGDHGKVVYYLSFYPNKGKSEPVRYSNIQSFLYDYDELLDELNTVLRGVGTGANEDIEDMLKD